MLATTYPSKGLSSWKYALFTLTDALIRNRSCIAVRRGFIFTIPFVLLETLMQFMLYLVSVFPGIPFDYEISEILMVSIKTLNMTFSPILAFCIGYNIGSEWKLKTSQCFMVGFVSLVAFKILLGNNLHYSSFHTITSALVGVFLSGVLMINIGIPLTRYFEHRLSFISSICLHNVMAIFPAMIFSVSILACMEFGIEYLSGGLSFQEWANAEVFHSITPKNGDDLWTATYVNLLMHFTSALSINGSTMFEGAVDTVYTALLMENIQDVITGNDPKHIINSIFIDNAMMMGGSGCLLALVFAILMAGCRNTTTFIAKLSLPMNLLNTNEILLFGLPVVLNPIFIIPFLVIPEINLLLAYIATTWDFVPIITHSVNKTIPPLISGYLAAGSINGALLQAFLLVLDTLMYLPFVYLFKQYESMHSKIVLQDVVQELHNRELQGKGMDFDGYNPEEQRLINTLIHELGSDVMKNSKRLFMMFQPQFTKNGTCIGAESLLRWNHPEYGFIYPPFVVALAKQGGFLFQLESLVIMKTCCTIAMIENKLHLSKFKIAANISGDMVANEKLESAVNKAVRSTEILPDHLWLEITEQDTLDLTLATMDRLDRLRRNGHHLCIDDFGMGHTSIQYLRTRKFDVVKIDGSLTRNILIEPESQQIVSSLNQLSKTLNLSVFAEFVETKEQMEKLAELGCDIYQGYYFSKPLMEHDFLKLLSKRSKRKSS